MVGLDEMICDRCEGEGYVRGVDVNAPGALVMLPCLDCGGSGVASCCDAAGSSVDASGLYRNEAYPDRACDRCGKIYRGPAVYCSIECAIEDA